MESKPVLHYFDCYGRAQPIRLLFSYLKIDFEDKFCPPNYGSQEEKKQWQEMRNNYQFKTVPVLEIDGHKLSQSRAILRYIAAKHGLCPTDPYDLWRNESLIDHFADTENGLQTAFFAEDKKKAFEEFTTKKLVHTFTVLEKRLKENCSQEYLVGNKITAADVLWMNFFWSYWMNPSVQSKEDFEQAVGLLKNYPTLQAYVNKRKGDFPRFETRKPSQF